VEGLRGGERRIGKGQSKKVASRKGSAMPREHVRFREGAFLEVEKGRRIMEATDP
jgi:hypothetical protein